MKEVWCLHEVKLPSVSLTSVSLEMQPTARLGLGPPYHLSLSPSHSLSCLSGFSQLVPCQLDLKLCLSDWKEKYIKVLSSTQSYSLCTCTRRGYSLACCCWSRRDGGFFLFPFLCTVWYCFIKSQEISYIFWAQIYANYGTID